MRDILFYYRDFDMRILRKLSELRNWDSTEFVGECRWALGVLLQYKGAVFVHLCLSVLSIVLSLSGAIVSKTLIDAVLKMDSGAIGFAACFYVLLRLFSLVFKSIASHIGALVDVRVHNGVQSMIYQKILNGKWSSLSEFFSGDLMERMGRDAGTVSHGVTHFVPTLLSGLVQFTGAFVLIYMCDAVMAWLCILFVPVTVVCSGFMMKRMRAYQKDMKNTLSKLVSFEQDSFHHLTLIKAFDLNEWFDSRLSDLHGDYESKYLSFHLFSSVTSFVMGTLALCSSLCCGGWAVYRLYCGVISFGEMTMVLQLSTMLGSSFSTLSGLVPALISIATSSGRILEVISLEEEKSSSYELNESSFKLELKDVTVGYTEQVDVLKECSLTVNCGEMVMLSGKSGCGKTTLFRVLLGLVPVKSGRASIVSSRESVDLSASTRRLFGYVPQGNPLFAGTIEENLRMGDDSLSEEDLIWALKNACAYDFVMALKDGLSSPVGGRDKKLSEGQAQRLSVARALLRNSNILLLDEATSALDEATEVELLSNIKKLGKTCIVVSHRSGVKRLCDRVVVLDQGACSDAQS